MMCAARGEWVGVGVGATGIEGFRGLLVWGGGSFFVCMVKVNCTGPLVDDVFYPSRIWERTQVARDAVFPSLRLLY